MRRESVVRFIAFAALTLLLVATAAAQFNAAIQGTVSDQSGAVVPGASITATNLQTSVSRTTVTSGAGVYRIAGLPPGNYSITVDSKGFKKLVRESITVSAETVRGLDLVLSPGSVEENVTVSAAAPALQTENANVNGTISSAMLNKLPQYGRDPYELLRLAPGVFGDGARDGNGGAYWFPNSAGPDKGSRSIFAVENQVQVTANGQRLSGNNFMIDGTSVNSLTWGGAAIVTPNQESIQEITVLSSSYSAEDGRNTGAQVKVISKSGTNAFHGSGIFKYNEPGLNAFAKWGGPSDAKPQRVEQKLRQFGGSIGGPVVKDKLFFFFSYEGNRSASSTTGEQWMETSQFADYIKANRGGFIAQAVSNNGSTPRVTNVLSTTAADCNDFAGQGYTSCTPMGTAGLDLGSPFGNTGDYDTVFTGPVKGVGGGLDGIPDLQRVQFLRPATSHGNQYNARVDYVTGRNTFAVSTYYTPRNDVTTTTPRPIDDLTYQPRNGYIALLWNRTFSPTLLNEFRVNATRFFTDQYSTNKDVLWGIPRLEIEMIPGDRVVWGPPASDNSPLLAAQNQFEFRDTVSKTIGRHNLKGGFQINLNQDNNNTMFGSSRPTFVYHGLWNFVNNAPIYEAINADPFTGAPTANRKYYRQHDYAFFAQDDFKLRPNLTVNVGLRYEYFAPLSEKYGQMSNAFLAAPNSLVGAAVRITNNLYEADRNNFAPRIGFAYGVNDKTVVRGGFGIAFNRITDTMTGISRVNPPYVYRYSICCASSNNDDWPLPPYADGQIDVNAVGTDYGSFFNYGPNPVLANNINPDTNTPYNGGIEIWGAPQNTRTPYVYTYSLEVERELPGKFVANLGYQGSAGHKFLRVVNLNRVAPDANEQTALSAVYFPSTDVNSNFNALNVAVNRPFANGLQLLSKYRWSKSIDGLTAEGAGQNRDPFWPADQRYDRGPSDFDTTHYLSITAMYDLPILRGRTDLLGRMLGGWHIDGTFTYHGGFPWSPKDYGANCPQVPSGTNNICPNLPTAYFGGAGTDYSNDTFMQPGGNFPAVAQTDGWKNYFSLDPQVAGTNPVPGINRNSFRGPRYRGLDLSLAKNTKFNAFGREGMALDFRANFYNAFNLLNLKPFEWGDDSTYVTRSRFGQATGALSGRVVEFQTRLTF